MFVQAQTLDECQRAAEANYPLIQRMELIRQTTDLTVQNIQKGWLPQVSAVAQATYQSDVTAFPEQIQSVYQQMGIDMKGLRKDQYRIGVDVQQTIFDGGSIRNQREVARQQGDVETAQNEVNIYNVRKRVNEMYFGLLLLDDQIQLKRDLQELLDANEKKLSAMFKGGTAAESDYQNVRAERLNVVQQLVSLQSQRQTLAKMLSVFCGIEVTSPVKPEAVSPTSTINRPELWLIDSQIRLADAQEKALNSALLPRLGVFAQGYYGYPGYNLFEDMMHRQWSLNGMSARHHHVARISRKRSEQVVCHGIMIPYPRPFSTTKPSCSWPGRLQKTVARCSCSTLSWNRCSRAKALSATAS